MVKYYLLLLLLFPVSVFSQTNYNAFTGENVNTITPTRLIEPYFCEYKDSNYNPIRLKFQAGFNAVSIPEDVLLTAYCGNYAGLGECPVYGGTKPDTTEKNGLVIIHKLTFTFRGTETALVKIAEMKDSIMGKYIIVQLQKAGNVWKPSKIKEIAYIENVIASIRTDIFWELYTKADSEIAGINDIKKKVKDDDGLLNVNKLSDYINLVRNSDKAEYSLICDN